MNLSSHWTLGVIAVRRFDQAKQVARHSSSRAAQEDHDGGDREDEDVQEEPMEAKEAPGSTKSPRKESCLYCSC